MLASRYHECVHGQRDVIRGVGAGKKDGNLMRKQSNGETKQCADCDGLVPAWTYHDRRTGETHDTCWRCRSAFKVCNVCGQFAPKDTIHAGNCERCDGSMAIDVAHNSV